MTSGVCRSALCRQDGAGAVELVVGTALLLFPVSLLLLSLPLLVEYRSMGDAAAREAVRACAIADDPRSGETISERMVQRIITERGLVPENVTVDVDCAIAWRPGGVVTASVSFEVPALRIVGIGDVGRMTILRTYAERIELHRSEPSR